MPAIREKIANDPSKAEDVAMIDKAVELGTDKYDKTKEKYDLLREILAKY